MQIATTSLADEFDLKQSRVLVVLLEHSVIRQGQLLCVDKEKQQDCQTLVD